jgi:hypothetical protein
MDPGSDCSPDLLPPLAIAVAGGGPRKEDQNQGPMRTNGTRIAVATIATSMRVEEVSLSIVLANRRRTASFEAFCCRVNQMIFAIRAALPFEVRGDPFDAICVIKQPEVICPRQSLSLTSPVSKLTILTESLLSYGSFTPSVTAVLKSGERLMKSEGRRENFLTSFLSTKLIWVGQTRQCPSQGPFGDFELFN